MAGSRSGESANPERLADIFRQTYRSEPEITVTVPGRVNLIGGHIDYSGGTVLPICIDRHLILLGRRRIDRTCRFTTLSFAEADRTDLDHLSRLEGEAWSNYLRGTVAAFHRKYPLGTGMDVLVGGDVPIGAGLSSSAALETATCLMCEAFSGVGLEDEEGIEICYRAERSFVGVQCGIMDQTICRMGRENSLMLLNCATGEKRFIPFPGAEVCLIVAHTGVARKLPSSGFNRRRQETAAAIGELRRIIPFSSLFEDITSEMLDTCRARLSEVSHRRLRHTLTENERVLAAAEALESGDIGKVGTLLTESHLSLRDCYEVSCRELDIMVGCARQIEGFLGARLSGGGFGGAALVLVRIERGDDFSVALTDAYRAESGREPSVYLLHPAGGPEVRPLPPTAH